MDVVFTLGEEERSTPLRAHESLWASLQQVETTSAPISDDTMTATIHAELERQGIRLLALWKHCQPSRKQQVHADIA
jgi:hypothetical protein